jgi:valyl-tRNA synthetase
LLRLMHPLIPFVTEELWDHFGFGANYSLITAPWPEALAVTDALAATTEVGWIVDLISEIRAVRSEMNVPPSQKSPVLLQDAAAETLRWAHDWSEAISRMARASEVRALTEAAPQNAAQVVLGAATIVLPLEGLIDLEAERKRLAAALAKARSELEKVEQKLANHDFTARAPEAVLDEHRERAQNFEAEAKRLAAALQRIS